MPSAAIITSTVSPGTHNGTVTGGSTDVFIDGLGAARAGGVPHGGDPCTCPGNGETHEPHDGHILTGSLSVFINSLPAARIGDSTDCEEHDAPDNGKIASGVFTVNIGG